jgi:hypothetical protein
MTEMLAGWIVSVALLIVCGFIALALTRILDALDRESAIPDASEPNPLAGDGRPAFSGEMRANAAPNGVVESRTGEQSEGVP